MVYRMKKIPVIATSFLNLFLLSPTTWAHVNASTTPQPTPIFQIDTAILEFQTFVRVAVPGKIVESQDPSLIGNPLNFNQTLEFSGSEKASYSITDTKIDEIEKQTSAKFCKEKRELTLKPFRQNSAIATQNIAASLLPSFINLRGTRIIGEKNEPFHWTVTCKL